jgi:hypothetical protein
MVLLMSDNHRGDLKRKEADLFARQFGVMSCSQAKRMGLTPRMIDRRRHSGLWRDVLPGVYRLVAVPPSWKQQLTSAILWGGPGTLVSHRAAAALWGMDGFRAGIVEITAPRSRRRPAPWCFVHSSSRLGPKQGVVVCGVPVTTVSRTLCDLGAVASHHRIQVALDQAIRTGRTSVSEIETVLSEVGGRGCRGAGVLRALIIDPLQEKAVPGSPLERRFDSLLRGASIPTPHRQFAVYDDQGMIGRIDFAWPDLKLGLEVDGYEPHSTRLSFSHDRIRRNRLTRLGWRLLHGTAADARSPDGIMRTLKSFFR